MILLLYAVLSFNTLFRIDDRLPSWDDLYYIFGLRSRERIGLEEGYAAIHFIDVGQGDCALIQTGTRNILIDSGEYEEYANVAQYLRDMGADRLDTVVISHPHSDHMGCMYRLVRRYGASDIVMPEVPETLIPVTLPYTKLLELAEELHIPVNRVRSGAQLDTDGFGKLGVLAPVGEYDGLNDSSVVLRYTFGDVSFLFCGDIEEAAEADILASGADISADVIKVPHHGSVSSSTRRFVQTVSPDYAVFSVGENNDYGHPHAEVVSLYENIGANILRTDMDGDIVFVTDGTELYVY